MVARKPTSVRLPQELRQSITRVARELKCSQQVAIQQLILRGLATMKGSK